LRDFFIGLVIAWPVKPPRHQTRWTFSVVAHHQPVHPAYRQAQPGRGTPRFQSPIDQRLNNLQPVQFAHAHRNHPRLVQCRGQRQLKTDTVWFGIGN
jgi:hypothetical protein